MSWGYKDTCPRCDVCGRFIGFADLESGAARNSMHLEPYYVHDGLSGPVEVYDSLCKHHNCPLTLPSSPPT